MRIAEQLERGQGFIWQWWFTLPYGLGAGLASGILLWRGLWFVVLPLAVLALYVRLRYGWPPFATALGLCGMGALALIVMFLALAGFALIA